MYAQFTYDEINGSTVTDGRNPNNWYWANWDGWRFNWVHASWNPYGPSVVGDETDGESEWINGWYRHWQLAQYEGYPYGGYDWWCQFSGQLMPFGSTPCYGGRY